MGCDLVAARGLSKDEQLKKKKKKKECGGMGEENIHSKFIEFIAVDSWQGFQVSYGSFSHSYHCKFRLHN